MAARAGAITGPGTLAARQVIIIPELTPLGERSMGARALCMLLRRELPLLALRDRSRLTRPALRRLGDLTPYTHLHRQDMHA